MTQDRKPQRTVDMYAEEWTPFGGSVRAAVDETQKTDERPSTVHADAAGWHPRIIEGGRGRVDTPVQGATLVDEDTEPVLAEDGPGVDVLDAAMADALAILEAPPTAAETEAAPVEIEPTPEPAAPAAALEAPASVLDAVAAAPEAAVQAPAAPAQEATPHPTLHTPTQAAPEAFAPAQAGSEAVETPHSTPWWKAAVGWLNPYEVLDQPLPPVSAIYEAAHSSVVGRNGFDQVTEIGWVYAIGMPITVACYTLAAAVQHKMRGIGVALTVLLWITAASTAPVDASIVWFWTAAGYWVSTALILPAVIQAKK